MVQQATIPSAEWLPSAVFSKGSIARTRSKVASMCAAKRLERFQLGRRSAPQAVALVPAPIGRCQIEFGKLCGCTPLDGTDLVQTKAAEGLCPICFPCSTPSRRRADDGSAREGDKLRALLKPARVDALIFGDGREAISSLLFPLRVPSVAGREGRLGCTCDCLENHHSSLIRHGG
jgi:hypothetical protein